MAAFGIDARRRAEKSDGFSAGHAASQVRDALFLILHFFEIAAAIFLPIDGRSMLAVEVGVQLFTGTEVFFPLVPGLKFFLERARAITAYLQAEAVVRFAGIVPALGLDRHHESPDCRRLARPQEQV